MHIKAKLYPYPVLAPTFNNDYIESDFNIEIGMKYTSTSVVINFKPMLKNEGLSQLIAENKASFVVHIECPLTSFRLLKKIEFTGLEYVIPIDKIEGKVAFCPFIIANLDIPSYSNNKFNPDYQGISFDIEKGNILAVGLECSLLVEKDNDELADIPSIFAVTEIKDLERTNIVIDNVSSNKINIQLPEKEFKHFKIAMNNTATKSIIHSMLVVPAIMKSINDLKNPDFYMEHSDKRWARAIKKALAKFNIGFDIDTLNNVDAFELAQKIMDNTICRGILDIQNIVKTDGDEE